MPTHDEYLLEVLRGMATSLENIDKTLAEPKNLSAHRVAANRRISKAMDYINDETSKIERMIKQDEDFRSGLEFPLNVLKKVRIILLSRE